jgi:hypothetical protein
VGEDEATIPDLVDELYKLCVYLLRISNVTRSTEKETTVMKDIFGENPKYQQIFVTWMIVLQRNTSKTWDAEEDVKVLEMLLYADIKRRTDLAKDEAPPLALESAKLNEVFGAEAKEVTDPFEIFGALMLAVYIMSAPSGNVLGDFIKRLEEDKDKWTAAYNTLGAMLFNGMKVSAVCSLTASRTHRFTNILLSRRRAGCWKLRRPRRINGICQRLPWCDKRWASQSRTVVSSTSCDHNLVYQHDCALIIFHEYSGDLERNERYPCSEIVNVHIAENDLDRRDGQGRSLLRAIRIVP